MESSVILNGLRLEVLHMVFSRIEEGDGNARIISSKSQMLS